MKKTAITSIIIGFICLISFSTSAQTTTTTKSKLHVENYVAPRSSVTNKIERNKTKKDTQTTTAPENKTSESKTNTTKYQQKSGTTKTNNIKKSSSNKKYTHHSL